MKYLSLKLKNFRMLRDIEINFSTDPEKKLTLISAANESGKTTTYHALGWILFGEKYLRGIDNDYSLTPISWFEETGKNECQITGELKFSVPVSIEGKNIEKKYRLVRKATESKSNSQTNFERQSNLSSVKLYEIKESGNSPIDGVRAENLINLYFPYKTHPIFLLNGDDIYTFLFNANDKASDRQKKMKELFRTVLDVEIVEKVIPRLKSLKSELMNNRNEDGGTKGTYEDALKIQSKAEESVKKHESELKEKQEEKKKLEDLKLEYEQARIKALEDGDKVEIKKELKNLKKEREKFDNQESVLMAENSRLLSSLSISKFCLSEEILPRAEKMLSKLVNEGEIPNQTVPYLQQKLKEPDCICGESLSDGTPDSENRKESIKSLIKNANDRDEKSRMINDLNNQTIRFRAFEVNHDDLRTKYLDIIERREAVVAGLDDVKGRIANMQIKLEGLSDTDVPKITERIGKLKEQIEALDEEITDINQDIGIANKYLMEAEFKVTKFKLESDNSIKLSSKIDFLDQSINAYESVVEGIYGNEREKLSQLTNELFLRMTGSKDEDVGAIRRVYISEKLELRVELQGGSDRLPGATLNGASLRALTLAFIFALCKVAEKEVPQYIDTPFGVTSDSTKQKIAEIALSEGSQIILAATFSETRDIERTLMKYLDKNYSVRYTFSSHFDTKDVVNPVSDILESKLCDCSFLERDICCNRKHWDENWPDEEYAKLLKEWK